MVSILISCVLQFIWVATKMIDCSVEVPFFQERLLLEIVTMKTVDWRKDQEVEL